ncbi:hypothetical protein JXB02_06410 [Candidatus Woesearchaeota archaeon]|nr:hypothetical protein [Candidatus Woesearchaeota archaeon]
MPEYLTRREAFLKCRKEGRFIVTEEVDIEKVKATLAIAEGDIQAALTLKRALPKKDIRWNGVYKLMYDALHELAEALLRLERIKIDNHQCLFAYLTEKHPGLEFSWEFFETVRTKRNGIHYYGTPVSHEDWKRAELQFTLYTKKLREEILRQI